MSFNDDLSQTNPIFAASQTYAKLGFSVIPLRSNEKIPAAAWLPYQHRHPTRQELASWFAKQDHGIGIVTGKISNLIVLDFDNPTLYTAFTEQHPDLAATFTVKTPRGYHLYYHLPEKIKIPSQQVPGIDLQSDGRYVVACPTTINNHTYTPIPEHPIQTLTITSKRNLLDFLDTLKQNQTPAAPEQFEEHSPEIIPDTLTVEGVVDYYHRLAAQIGRNNALFQVACLCRDAGWYQDKTGWVLADVHARYLVSRERLAIRRREALRTIASVYTRPPRPRRQQPNEQPTSQLSNAVREKLLSLKLTPVLRVLEGLIVSDIAPDTVISYSQLLRLLRPLGIGDWSIRAALSAKLPDGQPLFPPAPPNYAYAATTSQQQLTKNAFLLDDKNQRKIDRGRPQRGYRVPTLADLQTWLAVTETAGDPMPANALRGVKHYRGRLHEALIARRPGRYSRKWLAARLSVCVQTLRNYEATRGIQAVPMVQHVQLFWHNLTRYIPQDVEGRVGGIWLETAARKRYPLKLSIAKWLLSRGETVYYAWQQGNFYTTERDPSRMLMAQDYAMQAEQVGMNTDAIRDYWMQDTPTLTERPTKPRVVAVRVTIPPRPTPKRQAGESASYRAVDPNWVERVYAWINARANPERKVSRATLTGLMTQYGAGACRKAFKTLLARQDSVENPAGWLVVYLCSTGK